MNAFVYMREKYIQKYKTVYADSRDFVLSLLFFSLFWRLVLLTIAFLLYMWLSQLQRRASVFTCLFYHNNIVSTNNIKNTIINNCLIIYYCYNNNIINIIRKKTLELWKWLDYRTPIWSPTQNLCWQHKLKKPIITRKFFFIFFLLVIYYCCCCCFC